MGKNFKNENPSKLCKLSGVFSKRKIFKCQFNIRSIDNYKVATVFQIPISKVAVQLTSIMTSQKESKLLDKIIVNHARLVYQGWEDIFVSSVLLP